MASGAIRIASLFIARPKSVRMFPGALQESRMMAESASPRPYQLKQLAQGRGVGPGVPIITILVSVIQMFFFAPKNLKAC
jgi:hypothetical protein